MNETQLKAAKDLKSIAMSCLLQNTKHGRFFTQKEYEANRGKIDVIYNCYNKLI